MPRYQDITFDDIFDLLDFLNFPQAHGALLLPVNPTRIPPYIAGQMLGNEAHKFDPLSDAMRPYKNQKVVITYLTTGHNTTHSVHRWAQYGKDLAMINALCELKGWQGAGVAGAYSNWLCKRYKIRMLAENAAVESYNLKLRAKQTQKRIKARNKAKLRRQRFSRLNVGKRGIGGDFNASFPMKNSTRPIWSRRFFSGSSGSKAGFIYPNVRRQNYTITVTEPEFLRWFFVG